MIKTIIDFLMYPIRKYQDNKNFKNKIKELKKRDPFIYK